MLHENRLLQQAQALAGQAAADMTERANRVRDLRRLSGQQFSNTIWAWGITNHGLGQHFASQNNAAHMGVRLRGQALPLLSPDDEPEYVRRNFVRRHRRFRQLLEMGMRRFRFHAERDAWRRNVGAVGLPPADVPTQQTEQAEMQAWRQLLAQAAEDVLHEHQPPGHEDRADTGGASTEQLRLLRICAETGGPMDIQAADIRQMADCSIRHN
jgi:hypothetical protein